MPKETPEEEANEGAPPPDFCDDISAESSPPNAPNVSAPSPKSNKAANIAGGVTGSAIALLVSLVPNQVIRLWLSPLIAPISLFVSSKGYRAVRQIMVWQSTVLGLKYWRKGVRNSLNAPHISEARNAELQKDYDDINRALMEITRENVDTLMALLRDSSSKR